MGTSGIVRRIDELGRIVIPKEIRRTMRLREGDEMEITASGDQLVLKRFSQLENLSHAAAVTAKLLASYVNGEIYVTSTDAIIETSSKRKKEAVGARLTEKLAGYVMGRTEKKLPVKEKFSLSDNYEAECREVYLCPVISAGDLIGSVIVLFLSPSDDRQTEYVKFAAEMLSAVLSE